MEEFHLPITDEQAGKISGTLMYTMVSQITVSDQMRADIGTLMVSRMKLGVITNGPSAHQWRKRKTP